jgi:hypothetical protein
MPPECLNHGELKEKVKQAEDRIDCIEVKQQELRKPEEGALAKMHEKINRIAEQMVSKGEFRWVIGILVTIFIAVSAVSYSYTSDTAKQALILKERIDRETVTKQDLEKLKIEMKECLNEIKDEIRKKDGR